VGLEQLGLVGTFLTTFGVCLVSAIVPLVNAELYLLGASALAPRGFVPVLVIAGSLGQMAGKVAMYYAGRGALTLPWKRLQRMVAAVEERYRRGGADSRALGGGLIFVSSVVGIPPFYVVSIASGMFRIPLPLFFTAGMLGRLLRFGLVVLVPQLFKS
jgi:membrane protein YqaA with SNARE-associated domain